VSVAAKNAAGCLKIQVETGAVSGATCRIAAIWQKFVDTGHGYVVVIRDDLNTDVTVDWQYIGSQRSSKSKSLGVLNPGQSKLMMRGR
jgi:hypothetical protein